MINYYFIEYFRKLEGMSMQQLSEFCGKTGNNAKSFYSKSLSTHSEMDSENVQAIADALGISPAWITNSPVIMTKKDLDDYIDNYIKESPVQLIGKTDKSNQYNIISFESADILSKFADKRNEIGSNYTSAGFGLSNIEKVDEYIKLIKTSFLPDPDYTPMPLRMMLNYAKTHYDSIPNFVRAFVAQFPDKIKKARAESLIRDLVMAQSVPYISTDKVVFECFADFTNLTLDQVMCDFRLSSNESVFNLFLATSLTISDWVVTGKDEFTLTLTNPLYKPSITSAEPPVPDVGMTADFPY